MLMYATYMKAYLFYEKKCMSHLPTAFFCSSPNICKKGYILNMTKRLNNNQLKRSLA